MQCSLSVSFYFPSLIRKLIFALPLLHMGFLKLLHVHIRIHGQSHFLPSLFSSSSSSWSSYEYDRPPYMCMYVCTVLLYKKRKCYSYVPLSPCPVYKEESEGYLTLMLLTSLAFLNLHSAHSTHVPYTY